MATVTVEAPMAGSIKEVLVTIGEAVSEGQEVLIIDSMKMEIPVESTASGTVTEICVAPAQPVEEGAPLLRLATP
jgi:acetyl-CoA carboxylase biotin carboxyl carrier protein